ncbi:MAG: FHA domain-containing protein [Pseudomonadota bacterium]
MPRYSRFESTRPRPAEGELPPMPAATPDDDVPPFDPADYVPQYGKAPEPTPRPAPVSVPEMPAAEEEDPTSDIWDLDGPPEQPAAQHTAEPAEAEPMSADVVPVRQPTARMRRSRTRLIGFERSDGGISDPFESATVQTDSGPGVPFPVGWLVISKGPGRGNGFTLTSGMAQIGRDDDQAVQLDFGDTSVSRNNHAAVVYDPDSRDFLLGHGGKANIVRLNGKPVLSNETLADGDEITIGETTLVLKTLCGPDFSWDDDAEEEREDVAIT